MRGARRRAGAQDRGRRRRHVDRSALLQPVPEQQHRRAHLRQARADGCRLADDPGHRRRRGRRSTTRPGSSSCARASSSTTAASSPPRTSRSRSTACRRSRTARARSSRTRRRSSAKEIVDPYTIRFKTAAPHPLMPNDLSTIYIVSKKVATGASTEDFNSGKAAIGSGRYKFVRYVNGDRVELARNDALLGRQAAVGRRSRSRSSRTSRRAWRRCCPATSTRSSSRRPPTSRGSSPTRSSR